MRLTIRYIILINFILYVSGCAVGRSWDSPNVGSHEVSINTKIDVKEQITIWSRKHTSLVKRASAYPFMARVISSSENDKYPLIVVNIEEPSYSFDGNIFRYWNAISFVTLSIIPGYWYESSNITIDLVLKNNKGDTVTKSKSFVAKRSFISWLPLLPFSNYGFIVIDEWGTSNTSSFWNEAYEYYIKKFLFEERETIMQYGKY